MLKQPCYLDEANQRLSFALTARTSTTSCAFRDHETAVIDDLMVSAEQRFSKISFSIISYHPPGHSSSYPLSFSDILAAAIEKFRKARKQSMDELMDVKSRG